MAVKGYVGKHRLHHRKNLTARAMVAATVAVVAMVLLALGGPDVQAAPAAPATPSFTAAVAGAVTAVKHTVDQIRLAHPTTAGATAGADSGRKLATDTGALRKASFRLETCNAEG
jgi:hypothetical protein